MSLFKILESIVSDNNKSNNTKKSKEQIEKEKRKRDYELWVIAEEREEE